MDYIIPDPTQLGTVLRGHRQDRGLTQADLGHRVGLAQNAVSNLESDPSQASIARVFKLLAALDLEFVVRDRRKGRSASDW